VYIENMTKKATPIFRSREVVDTMAKSILEMFSDFDMPMKLVDKIDGFRNYYFYLQPKKRVRMKSIHTFADDLKYELSTNDIQIEAPIPDKKLIGITVAKKPPFKQLHWDASLLDIKSGAGANLHIPLGIDDFGELYHTDITRMPHALIAGTTGSGKSIFLHSMLNYLLEANSPEQLRFIMVDPKRIELTLYNKIPHLLTPVITDARKTLRALSWAVKEMERRYDILESEKVANIRSYRENIYEPAKKQWQKAGAKPDKESQLPEALPYILIVVDEINDIMQAYPNELEACVVRLAQMSRAVGIHLILSTQRPSVNVITGSVKANIPTRMAFAVASQVDSRTILDTPGAEKLIGPGDMLYLPSDSPRPIRLQTFYISEEEVKERVKKCIKAAEVSAYDILDFSAANNADDASIFFNVDGEVESDELYEEAKQATIEAGKVSTSYLQRKFRIGYSRAARLVDLLEFGGVIGPQDGSKPREILVDE
jgi:S-DNA-T family DNA segregation ATPase FtsK/SpoIIIE